MKKESRDDKALDKALKQILLAPTPKGQRSENRAPTKDELEMRYRLERRK